MLNPSNTSDYNDLPEIISVEAVASYLGKQARWCYSHHAELGGKKIGGCVFFTKEGLRHALQRRDEMAGACEVQGRTVHMPEGHERSGKAVGSRRKKAAEIAEKRDGDSNPCRRRERAMSSIHNTQQYHCFQGFPSF